MFADDDLHPAAQRLPTSKKTGNALQDKDNEAVHAQLQQMLSGLLRDPSHVPALHKEWQDRAKAAAENAAIGEGLFQKAPASVQALTA